MTNPTHPILSRDRRCLFLILLVMSIGTCKAAAEDLAAPATADQIIAAQRSYFQQINSIEFICDEHFKIDDSVLNPEIERKFPYQNTIEAGFHGDRFYAHYRINRDGVEEYQAVTFDGTMYMHASSKVGVVNLQSHFDPGADPMLCRNPLTMSFMWAYKTDHELSLRGLQRDSYWENLKLDVIQAKTVSRNGKDFIQLKANHEVPGAPGYEIETDFSQSTGYFPVKVTGYLKGAEKQTVVDQVEVLEFMTATISGKEIVLPVKLAQYQEGQQNQPIVDVSLTMRTDHTLKLNQSIPDEKFQLPMDLPNYVYNDVDRAQFLTDPDKMREWKEYHKDLSKETARGKPAPAVSKNVQVASGRQWLWITGVPILFMGAVALLVRKQARS